MELANSSLLKSLAMCLAGSQSRTGKMLRILKAVMCMQFQRNRFAEDMRRRWVPRWLGYQLSRIRPLFFRWRGSLEVNAAFKVCTIKPGVLQGMQ